MLIVWCGEMAAVWPELELLYHIPNGGRRNKAEAARFSRAGVRRGVPDLCLPVPRGAYAGLYIELKRTRGGAVSPEQKDWLSKLAAQGYRAVVCKGAAEAKQEITQYMESEQTQ
jgi:hypothetical protein